MKEFESLEPIFFDMLTDNELIGTIDLTTFNSIGKTIYLKNSSILNNVTAWIKLKIEIENQIDNRIKNNIITKLKKI